MKKFPEEENLVSWSFLGLALEKRSLILEGTVLEDALNIMDDTVSTWNIYGGEILEEITMVLHET